jgi:co-chaperonin GroES (HSP10)
MTINTSGIKPWEYKVLVRPDIVSETSKGGIHYSEQVRQQMQNAMCKGTIVAVSRLAFNYDADMKTVIPPDERPTVGMRVIFAKYAGGEVIGDDHVTYRMLNDKDIMGEVTSRPDNHASAPALTISFPGHVK